MNQSMGRKGSLVSDHTISRYYTTVEGVAMSEVEEWHRFFGLVFDGQIKCKPIVFVFNCS